MTTDEHSELSKELEEFQSSMPHAALFSDLEVLPGGEGFRFMGTRILGALSLDVILTFATPSTFHGVAKHAIFAGVQRQRRSAPAEQGAQHL